MLDSGSSTHTTPPNQAEELALTTSGHLATSGPMADVLERMTDALFAVDAGWRLTYLNSAAARLLSGEPREALLGQLLWEVFPDAAESNLPHHCEQARATGAMVACTTYLAPRNRWYAVRAYPDRDEGLTISIQDATAEYIAQEQLHWQAALLEQAHDALFVWELGGAIIYWNAGATELYGYRHDEAVGHQSHTLLQTTLLGDEFTSFQEFEGRLAQTGQWRGTLWHVARDGRRLIIHAHMQVVRTPDGRQVVLESTRDMTVLEEALQRAEVAARRFESMVEMNVSGVLIGRGEHILEANAAFQRMLGYDPTIYAPISAWGARLPPDFPIVDAALIAELSATGSATPFEKTYTHADGSQVACLVAVTMLDPVTSPAFEEFTWIAFFVDLSERKRLEDSLRARDEELRRVTESAGVGLIRCSRDRRYRTANPAYARLVGVPLAEMIGRRLEEIVGQRWVDAIQPYVVRVLRGEQVEYEADLVLPNDEVRSVHVIYVPDEDLDGQIIGWVASITDISARKAAEAQLYESEQRYRKMLENAAVGIARVALDGHWLEVNQRLCAILGYGPDELLEHTFQDLTYPDDLATDLAHVEQLVRGEIVSYKMEKRYFRKDGEIVWAMLSVTLVRDAEEVPQYFVSIVEDISARKSAEEALSASEELFHTLADNMSQLARMADRLGSIFLFNQRWY